MECDPPLGMSSYVIHLIEFYEQGSHIGEPACLLPSTHPPFLAAWGRGVGDACTAPLCCLSSDFLPALENVQGAGQSSSRDPLPHGPMLFAFTAGSDAQISM